MNAKVQDVDGMRIDYSKSSIEVFPAISRLADSDQLYFKFSRNRIKTLEIEKHAELVADFDLCVIDRTINETVVQLFAIFKASRDGEPMNDRRYVAALAEFGRSLIEKEIEAKDLKDASGRPLKLPPLHVESELLAV